MKQPRIIYLVPDSIKPSWGIGVIYHHVAVLNEAGKAAFIMHDKKGFTLPWLSLDVPKLFLSALKEGLSPVDILVVPEVMVDQPIVRKSVCKKAVFVQNLFYAFEYMPANETHRSLGFSTVISIMPHMLPAIEHRLQLPNITVPPFVADYFYKAAPSLHEREQLIVLYPKYSALDYGILKRFVDALVKEVNHKSFVGRLVHASTQWKVVELKDKSHEEVAVIMKKAAVYVSLSTFEAFNTSVPEAMAAGCINVCYEAVGPADFLADGHNAYVFPNNHIYPLVQKVIDVVKRYADLQPELAAIRINARETADRYTLAQMAGPVLDCYEQLVGQQ